MWEECRQAQQKYETLNSCHEGYAVILEELEEAWQIIRMREEKRDYAQLRRELVQTAAMCVRVITDVIGPKGDGKE